MKTLTVAILLALSINTLAQKAVSEYTPAERGALQAYIEQNSSYKFMPETWFDAGTLKAARNEWGYGRAFKPYFQRGDFNRDGLLDFAVILTNGKNVNDKTAGMRVVVFNGVKGGSFRVAHSEDEEFSTALFINTKRNKLYVGVMETDSIGCFKPSGRGYIVESCGM